jgi:hypothetical protein
MKSEKSMLVIVAIIFIVALALVLFSMYLKSVHFMIVSSIFTVLALVFLFITFLIRIKK